MSWEKLKGRVEVVGLIGVGTMGKCMLQKLVEAGYKTVVYDPIAAARNFANSKGAEVVSDPAGVAAVADIVIMSLPGPNEIEKVIFGENGLASSLIPGKVVIDTSTVDPDTSRVVSGKLEALGVAYLDAPILGRPSAVGRWLMPVGGAEGPIEYCKPVFLSFASGAVPVGPSGSGNAIKLLNQLMFSTINAITTEVLAISAKVGVEPKIFYETVASSGAATVSGLFCEVAKKIVESDYHNPIFTIDLLCKDSNLALKMAKDCGAPSFMAGLAQIYNDVAKGTGLGKEDTSALHKVYERLYCGDDSSR